ncbi:two-component system, chemotaxis family, sensor kinase CheA [Natronincola peptidivorans]|uniref:Chemotaxis protein CheA n=1 Tax=Natronincola peptidivorans TaxID=426128 RepID=A0A1H9YFW8_9FIRM|nr:chemotaxis protein CheA [Natronincola peptidivorans]SES67920.1 two-component system, chemotaxis family, sensor kinase CheA [Natronincola peptidivorans]
MDMSQYLDIFMEESKENLQSMNDILMKLESSPEDISLLNEIFRIAHTLKGMSGTMGFSNISSLTHEMENILDDIRNGKIRISNNVIDLLFECFDELEKYVNEIEKHNNEGGLSSSDLIEKLQQLMKAQEDDGSKAEVSNAGNLDVEVQQEREIIVNEYVDSTIKRAAEKNYNVYLVKVSLDKKCMLKSARAYIVINTLEKIAEVIQSTPSIEDIEDEKFDFHFELIIVSKNSKDFIASEMNNISEIESIEIADILDRKLAITPSNDDELTSELEDREQTVNKAATDANEDVAIKKTKTGKTVRVDIDRLDNLMNLVSELIIIKTRLEDIDDSEKRQRMNEATEHLERITTSLHDAVMKVRMVPIERVFNRFPRMVRDLSKELNKEISLIMTGADTEVDRTVIDEIGDPLIHLIRNSIDHGIEDMETRERSSKDKKGTVKLSAYPDGNSVVIEVEDDGKGIDIEKVKGKAIEKNIISLQQSQLMEDNEIIQLLFAPGFSTADKISDLSGRGVGLDVVKTKIEALGGTVEVDSFKGQGSKFIIRLPLTLAIIQALLVVTGEEKYAIPLNNIKEISTITSKSIRKVQGNEVVLFRNATLPIMRLANLLKVPNINEDQEEYTIVIVKKGDRVAGIVVDELIGQQEIVIKSLGKYLASIKGIAGATILGNGSVALIIDTNSFY